MSNWYKWALETFELHKITFLITISQHTFKQKNIDAPQSPMRENLI